MKRIKSLFISDIHIGSKVSKPDLLLKVLNKYDYESLYIVGDFIDDDNLSRLNQKDWKILSEIRKTTENKPVYWIKGNHCRGVADILAPLIGAEVKEEIILFTKDKKIYLTHGDCFDKVVSNWKRLTSFSCKMYKLIQCLDIHEQKIALFIKKKSKQFIRAVEKVKKKVIEKSIKNGFDGCIIGHLHHEEFDDSINNGEFLYMNTGSFTEANGKCSYIILNKNDKFELKYI